MKVERIVVGSLENNVYIVGNDKEIIVIDPAGKADLIFEKIGTRAILGVFITHKHFDHIGALKTFLEKGIKEYSYETIKEEEIHLGIFNIKVFKNPGHSKDSLSFIIENNMFSGDFVFKDDIGRCDLPGGDFNEMLNSISKLKEEKINYIIYPGHGDSTTLDYERKNNVYFNYNVLN